MNSKTLVLVAFTLWTLVCWRWYVCGIKQQCGDQPAVRQETPVQPIEDVVEEETETTSGIEVENVPEKTPPPSQKPTAGANQRSNYSEDNINRVQVEELDDHVVIHFPYQSSQKEENDAVDDYLDRLADYLKQSGKTATISGHTDFVGDTKSNYNMALRRAQNIRNILVNKGVDKKQLRVKSFGESKSIASNDTPKGRYKNRRVEIHINN